MTWSIPLAHGRTWTFSEPQVVAILNATPDSFSDGGQLDSAAAIEARVHEVLAAGVRAFDVGGESTRPGHTPVPTNDEIQRVVPVVQAVRRMAPDAIISIDTSKAAVASAALAAGADWVNDVSGMGDPAMADVVKQTGCGIVLMRHATLEIGALESCQQQLAGLVEAAIAAGVPNSALVLDPGLGFGERPGPDPEDNLALLEGVHAYAADRPVMIGHSRKRFVASLAAKAELDVDSMTAQLCRTAAEAGAALLRVHDVGKAVAALTQC